MSESIVRFRVFELRPHPLLERVAMLPAVVERQRKLAKTTGKDRKAHADKAEELTSEWFAFVDDVAAHGVLEPLKVTADGLLVVDGRHRLAAARQAGLAEVPAILVQDKDAQAIILSAVCARRHFSKGALAYIALLTHPEVATEGEARAKAGQPSALSAEGLAKRTGVSLRLIGQAAALYRELDGFPKLAEDAEHSIFSGAGLGAVHGWVKQAKSGSKATNPRPKPRADYDVLGPTSLVTLQNTASRWADLKPETRESMIGGLRELLCALPEPVRDAITS